MLKIRVRKGQSRPIVGCDRMPEHPEYIDVPAGYADALHGLVEAGVCEYMPADSRAVRAEVDAPVIVTAPVIVADRAGFPARRRARS